MEVLQSEQKTDMRTDMEISTKTDKERTDRETDRETGKTVVPGTREEQPVAVTVLTTAYNHAAYIRQTIESIVTQKTDKRFELIIHDDASTDGTADIIREYEAKYPEIIKAIYQTENQYSKGKNVYDFMMPYIRGRYIALCEGDDYWCDETKLDRQIRILDENPGYTACVHQTERLDCRTGEKRALSSRTRDGVLEFEEIAAGGNHAFQVSSMLARTKYLADPDYARFTSFSRVGDYPTSIYLALKGEVYYLARTMSVYRWFSTADAWSSRITADTAESIRHNEQMIALLTFANEYSQGKYDAFLKERIDYHRYGILKDKNSRETFRNVRYRRFFWAESRYMRTLLIAKAYLPERVWKLLKKCRQMKKGAAAKGRKR